MRSDQSRFLALLRGINVGGKNVITKSELKRCFEELGFGGVRTYIQSGNILFRAGETSVKTLTRAIEKELSARFSYAAQAVVLSHETIHIRRRGGTRGLGAPTTSGNTTPCLPSAIRNLKTWWRIYLLSRKNLKLFPRPPE